MTSIRDGIKAIVADADLSHPVEAFRCSRCESLYKTRDSADGCCCCSTCGEKFKPAAYSNQCGHCSYGVDLREARASLRRSQDHLKSDEQRLARLLSEKRPPKGSPR